MRGMSGGGGVKFSMFKGGASGTLHDDPGRDVQELWFALAKLRWSSLVLVPADAGISAGPVATALADVGSRLRDTPVAAIVADEMDYESARILADLQLHVHDDRDASQIMAVERAPRWAGPNWTGGPGEPASTPDVEVQEPPRQRSRKGPAAGGEPRKDADDPPTHGVRALPPAGRLVVAIQPVIVEPLGVAVAHAADAVVLCVQLGETHMKAAQKTIELIGSERIAGAFIVR
jgi:hypothetical protein